MTIPLSFGKFLTQVTTTAVVKKVALLVATHMKAHICQRGGGAIRAVTASHIMRYPNTLCTAPMASTNHGGATSYTKPDTIPTDAPKVLNTAIVFKVSWS